ncbi:hypothetical protein QFZ66_004992 [Streptomyces sp. B4I13]|uniref:hypothetical protein n=1 Tax=Streptomyces sp. B4I13 TaxID=3042271 RepID=UPI00277FDEEA|nr:hypothetical protein [Streptomyces sp. B4I13]MDQ0961114.1 hypothetical protein [Streptomyces sp. B4I13]
MPPEAVPPAVEAGRGARRAPACAAPPPCNPFPYTLRERERELELERVRRVRPARDPLAEASSAARRPTAFFPTDG